MTTRDTSLRDILYPQGNGMPDAVWTSVVPKPGLAAVFPNFGADLLDAVHKDIKTTMDSMFQMSPLDILKEGWKKYREVAKALDDSKKKPDEPIIKPLLKHTVKSVHHPYIELMLDDAPVWKIEFEVTAALDVEGASLKIQNGQITNILTGTCQGKIQLSYSGHQLTEAKTSRFNLPGSIPLKPAKAAALAPPPSPEKPASLATPAKPVPTLVTPAPPESPEKSASLAIPAKPTPTPAAPAPPESPEAAPPLAMPAQPAPTSDASTPHAHLIGVGGEIAGRVFQLTDGAVIGRSSENLVTLFDPSVSRHHARLRQASDRWFIQDMNSTGGTLVNGKRVEAVALENGDHIRIGSFEFEFHD